MRVTGQVYAENLRPGDVYLHPLGGKATVSSIDIVPCFDPRYPDDICLQVERTAFGKTMRIAHGMHAGEKVELISRQSSFPSENGKADSLEEKTPNHSIAKLFWDWITGNDSAYVFWEWMRS